MTETKPNFTPGRVVWRELMTQDAEKAKAFYAELFGWQFQAVEMGMGPYNMIKAGDKMIGGLMQSPKEMPMSAWISVVSVKDVDAVAKTATENGGKVLAPPMDIPNVGRFAMLQDFAGAVINVLRTATSDPVPAMPKVNEFCWETLATNDIDKAKEYYGKLFGWQTQKGPEGTAAVFAVDDTREGQIADIQKAQNFPPFWGTYVVVTRIEPSRDRVAKLGGKVMMPLIEIPKVGRISMIADPTGGAIGLYEPAPM